MIPHSNLVYTLSQTDTFVDVSEEDLQRIYALAMAPLPNSVGAAGLQLVSQTRVLATPACAVFSSNLKRDQ